MDIGLTATLHMDVSGGEKSGWEWKSEEDPEMSGRKKAIFHCRVSKNDRTKLLLERHFILSFRSLHSRSALTFARCTPCVHRVDSDDDFGTVHKVCKLTFLAAKRITLHISLKSNKILMHCYICTMVRLPVAWFELQKKNDGEIPPINVAQILFYKVVIFNDYSAASKCHRWCKRIGGRRPLGFCSQN